MDGSPGRCDRQHPHHRTRKNVRRLHQHVYRTIRREALSRRLDSVNPVLILPRIRYVEKTSTVSISRVEGRAQIRGIDPIQPSPSPIPVRAVLSVAAPIASILAEHFTPRAVTLCGAVIACAGMGLSSQARTLSHLYFSYGILMGE